MKHLKLFQTETERDTYLSGDVIKPNISVVKNEIDVVYIPKPISIITFTINGTAYQAQEGMTFYDWAMSEYYDSSCSLCLKGLGYSNLRDNIIEENVSSSDSITIAYGAGADITPAIYTDTIIQPITYTPNFGGFGGQ